MSKLQKILRYPVKLFGYSILTASLLIGGCKTTIPKTYVISEQCKPKEVRELGFPVSTEEFRKDKDEETAPKHRKEFSPIIDPKKTNSKYLVPKTPERDSLSELVEKEVKEEKYNGLLGGGVTTGSKTLDTILFIAILGALGKYIYDHDSERHHRDYGGGEGLGGPGLR